MKNAKQLLFSAVTLACVAVVTVALTLRPMHLTIIINTLKPKQLVLKHEEASLDIPMREMRFRNLLISAKLKVFY
jgi:hypothetical protein